jgi:zeta-carotene desaturase
VIRELFMNSAFAGAMGMSRVPLGELYATVPSLLHRQNGEVLLHTNVESAVWHETSSQWILRARGAGESMREVSADFLVLALPFEGLQRLLPVLPAAEGKASLAAQVEKHEHWPICSVHLWFDRPITDLEHAVLLDREIHWMYNQSKLQNRDGNYIELVVSATRTFAALPREEAIRQALAELAEFFPATREAKLLKVALVKEMRATFAVPPGIDAHRPQSVAPWPNCYLAGDWTATGWPSTMESAARSGHLAAEAVTHALGRPRTFLEADLKPKGLMKLMARGH